MNVGTTSVAQGHVVGNQGCRRRLPWVGGQACPPTRRGSLSNTCPAQSTSHSTSAESRCPENSFVVQTGEARSAVTRPQQHDTSPVVVIETWVEGEGGLTAGIGEKNRLRRVRVPDEDWPHPLEGHRPDLFRRSLLAAEARENRPWFNLALTYDDLAGPDGNEFSLTTGGPYDSQER